MKDIMADLSIDELICGYINNDSKAAYQCVFCSEEFEEGVIYFSRGRNVDAQKAVAEHVYDKHDGPFESLLKLDKDINGLTDVQKVLLTSIYESEDNKMIGERLNIKASTVRAHKFKLQQLKREAKIYLALFAYLEDNNLIQQDENLKKAEASTSMLNFEQSFSGNVLHPFFAQFNLK